MNLPRVYEIEIYSRALTLKASGKFQVQVLAFHTKRTIPARVIHETHQNLQCTSVFSTIFFVYTQILSQPNPIGISYEFRSAWEFLRQDSCIWLFSLSLSCTITRNKFIPFFSYEENEYPLFNNFHLCFSLMMHRTVSVPYYSYFFKVFIVSPAIKILIGQPVAAFVKVQRASLLCIFVLWPRTKSIFRVSTWKKAFSFLIHISHIPIKPWEGSYVDLLIIYWLVGKNEGDKDQSMNRTPCIQTQTDKLPVTPSSSSLFSHFY